MAVVLPYAFDTLALPGNILTRFNAGSVLMLFAPEDRRRRETSA
jgi:hypothetical protein